MAELIELNASWFFLCFQVGRETEDEAEGEAERYFHHAITLRNTLLFLRYNKELFQNDETIAPMGLGRFFPQ